MFSRLSHFILLSLAGVLILVMLLVSLLFLRNQNAAVVEQQQGTLEQLARSVSGSLEAIMLEGNGNTARHLVSELQGIPEVAQLEVIRPNGSRAFLDNQMIQEVNKRLMSSRFPSRDNEEFAQVLDPGNPDLMRALGDQKPVRFLSTSSTGEPLISFLYPLKNKAQCQGCHGFRKLINGLVLVSAPAGSSSPLGRLATDFFWLQFGGIALVLVIMALLLKAQVTRRLSDLTNAVNRTLQGERLELGPSRDFDEIGQLINGLNAVYGKSETGEGEGKRRSFELSVQQSPNAIAILTAEGELEFVNDSFAFVTGYAKEHATEAFERGIQFGKPYKALLKEILKGNDPKKIWRRELPCHRPDGELCWLSVRLSGLRNSEGVVQEFACIAEEISARKQFEEEMRGRSARLQEIQEELERQGAVLEQETQARQSLELRLGQTHRRLIAAQQQALTGYVASLGEDGSHDRLTRLNQQLAADPPEPLDLTALLEETLAAHETALAGSVSVVRALSPELPEITAERTWLVLLAEQLLQGALATLGENAQRDSAEEDSAKGEGYAGSEARTLSLESGAGNEQVWFEIGASGWVGRSAVDDDDEGTRFAQGMALALSHRVAYRHGGHLALKASGSDWRVRVWLPLDARTWLQARWDQWPLPGTLDDWLEEPAEAARQERLLPKAPVEPSVSAPPAKAATFTPPPLATVSEESLFFDDELDDSFDALPQADADGFEEPLYDELEAYDDAYADPLGEPDAGRSGGAEGQRGVDSGVEAEEAQAAQRRRAGKEA